MSDIKSPFTKAQLIPQEETLEITKEKGELFIDALEDSVVTPISKSAPPKSDFQKLHKRIGVLQKRIIMLMSAPAIERYNHFLEIYPDIVQRVPQRMIASYLGITPQALSTLRGEIAKGK